MHRIAEMQPVSEISSAEIHQYRSMLRAKLAELEAGVRRLDGIAVETAPDAMDESAFANGRDFEVERLVQMASMLVSTRAALDRIADGSYGACLDCGQTISPKRLAVLPWAGYCRPCQENLDLLRDTGTSPLRLPEI